MHEGARHWVGARLQKKTAMKAINNIDCVRLNIDWEDRVIYLPSATSFNTKFIDSILFYYLPYEVKTGVADPLTNKEFISMQDAGCITVNIKGAEGTDIIQNASISSMHIGEWISYGNINSVVDWDNSYIRINGRLSDTTGQELLMYIIYSTSCNDSAPTMQRTIDVPYNNGVATLADIINSPFYDSVREIEVSPALAGMLDGAFMTLVSSDGRVFDFIPLEFFWRLYYTDINDVYVNAPAVRFNNLVIDWQKSRVWQIYNSENIPIKLQITFKL